MVTNEIQREAFNRRLGHCVKVVRLSDGDLAILDQYDIVRHLVGGGSQVHRGEKLWRAIHDILDNPTVRKPFTLRPNPEVQEVADQFLKDLGL